MSAADLCCPMCGIHLDLGHLIVAADDRAAFLRLLEVSLPIGATLLRYVQLFAPPKTSLTQRKQARIIVQLLPDLQRAAITHRGREWAVPLKVWQAGIDQMLAARDAGKLELPMKSHGYLYAILSSLADKTEAVAEAQTEAAKRAPRQDTVTVHGQPMPMGQALAQVFGGQCAALAKLDAERGTAAPMPESVRQHLASLKNPRKSSE
jgi:hypothetical protein